jgi:hypothetical protein
VPATTRRLIEREDELGAIETFLDARAQLPGAAVLHGRAGIGKTSAGNPFFALEPAGALQRHGGTLAPGEQLPIPSELGELLHARLDVPLVESAVNRHFQAGLTKALAVRILELDGERLRFTHPLLGSAVAARQTPSSRRALHACSSRTSRTPASGAASTTGRR